VLEVLKLQVCKHYLNTFHSAEIYRCRPILDAKECAIGVMAACGVFEMTEPRVVEAMRILTVANDVVNYVCRDHVQGTQSFFVSFLLRPVPTANAGLATVSSSCATTQSTFTSASLAYVGLHIHITRSHGSARVL